MPFYDTPDAPAGDPLVCRSFALRPGLWRVVFDHLAKLTRESQWAQSDTGMSVEQATEEIESAIDAGVFRGCVMIGQVQWIAVAVPDWCLLCDGSTYARVEYPDLYAVLQAGYVIDADNFTVPDLIDRFPMGAVDAGSQGGEAEHTLTLAEIPGHAHSEQDPGSVNVEPGVGAIALADPGLPSLTGSAGGGGAHNNIPPYETLTPVIVARWPDA